MEISRVFGSVRSRNLFVLSAVASGFFYELALGATMRFFIGSAVLWTVMISGVFLLGVQAGSFREARVPKKERGHHFLRHGLVLHLTGAVSVLILHLSWAVQVFLANLWGLTAGLVVFFSILFFLAADIGSLSGKVLAFLIDDDVETAWGQTTDPSGLLLGLGSLAGGLLFIGTSLVWDVWLTVLVVAAVNVGLLAILIFVQRPLDRVCRRYFVLASIGLLLLVGGLFRFTAVRQVFLKNYYHHLSSLERPLGFLTAAKDYPRIERFFSSRDRIDLVRVPGWMQDEEWPVIRDYTEKFDQDPDFPRGYMVYFNGRFIFRSDTEEIPSEYLAHVPVILNGAFPRRVLVLDLGAGLITRELIKYAGIDKITQISFSPELARLTREHALFRRMSRNAFDDPRVEMITADAFSFLRSDGLKYDAIYMDMPVPDNFRFSRFYTLDFFDLVKAHLNPDGYFAFQAPGSGHFSYFDETERQAWSAKNKWPVYRDTLQQAGFDMIVPYVSALELYREQAAEDLLERIGPPEIDLDADLDVVRTLAADRLRPAIVRDSLMQYVYALQEGFIFAKAAEEPDPAVYRSAKVGLYVLTQPRFARAFGFEYPPRDLGAPAQINSLIRPRLPGRIWWDL